MTYTNPVRRRARQVRRLAAASTHRAMWRGGVVVPATWWDGHPNFGDDLTPWLLPAYGIAPVHRVAGRARLSGVGSILEFLPEDYAGAVWGSGLMYGRPHPLPRAEILAVRGHLTRDLIGAPDDVALGDPGLLVARRAPRPRVRWDVALVPHGHHRGHEPFMSMADAAGLRVRVVNVHQSAARVVREIAAADAVVTTSLHGLVTADAYGIPATWTMLDPPLSGGPFKFHDYESVVTPGRSRFTPFDAALGLRGMLDAADVAPRETVERACDDLERSIARLGDVVPGLPRYPVGAFGVLAGRG
ncbi:polysaccharide pyruvyl transferase family protein [Agromyces binzhouensis]|uniref:Polysaccharide pyruvyl transferase family protein n=1 Tax=Agromyces binzhouensis TaxID=1817495 RepID=A0A4Q2JQ42_9MICO|nr:polysaccharide pyruvyl transferase family protein [Agromyces binzhouensis]RXZ50152.1 polysaccharide pyruvyl transferase family protein [Agromyces binzhouensis]